jgi:hypothetical protein
MVIEAECFEEFERKTIILKRKFFKF